MPLDLEGCLPVLACWGVLKAVLSISFWTEGFVWAGSWEERSCSSGVGEGFKRAYAISLSQALSSLTSSWSCWRAQTRTWHRLHQCHPPDPPVAKEGCMDRINELRIPAQLLGPGHGLRKHCRRFRVSAVLPMGQLKAQIPSCPKFTAMRCWAGSVLDLLRLQSV